MVSSLHSRFALETFLLQGRSAKILGTEILARHWRHAAFASQRGGAKIMVNSLLCGLFLEPSSSKVGSGKFWPRKF